MRHLRLSCLSQDETEAWERRLAILSEGLQLLNGIQRKWVYLEPIFARGALPHEQSRFRRVYTLCLLSGSLCCLNPTLHMTRSTNVHCVEWHWFPVHAG